MLHLTPSLKLKPDGLARSQILSAAKAVRVEHGYLELNTLDNPADPRVSILDMNRASKSNPRVLRRFTTARLRLSICLLLYDVARNRDALSCQSTVPSPSKGEGQDEGDSLDSILESILLDSETRSGSGQHPLSLPAVQEELSIDSSLESTEEKQPEPTVEPASPQLIALFAELRSALIALLGRARAARSLNRALTSSLPGEASKLRPVAEADLSTDPPAIETEDEVTSLIRCCIHVPDHLIINRRKARERLAQTLANGYSRHYSGLTPKELNSLESFWKELSE